MMLKTHKIKWTEDPFAMQILFLSRNETMVLSVITTKLKLGMYF